MTLNCGDYVIIQGGDRTYRVIALGLDSMVKVTPMYPDDTRDPFWIGEAGLTPCSVPTDLCGGCGTAPCGAGGLYHPCTSDYDRERINWEDSRAGL